MTQRSELIERLQENFQSIRRKLMSKDMAKAHKELCDITPSQWSVLRVIHKKERVSTKELAAHLDVTSSAATQLVDSLVASGHLKRSGNPDDGRSQYIELSPTTRKRMKVLRRMHLERLSEIFSALSDKELTAYLKLSDTVARNISK